MVSLDTTAAVRQSRHLFLAAVCLLALFAGLGRVSMWEPDEARFAEATRQMLARGDVLTPWFNDRPRFEKPVGLYWLQLPFVAVLGSSELAARLPVALAGAGCVLFTYLIGRRLFGGQVAWIAALALVTSFRVITHARQGLTDIPALFFELMAMYGFLRAHQDGAGRAWMAGWGATGLAALIKGPVAAIPAWRLGGVPDGDARLERASPPAHRARRARRRGDRRALVRVHDGGARACVRGRGARERGGRRGPAAMSGHAGVSSITSRCGPPTCCPGRPSSCWRWATSPWRGRASAPANGVRLSFQPSGFWSWLVRSVSRARSCLITSCRPIRPPRCWLDSSSIAPARTRQPAASGGPAWLSW